MTENAQDMPVGEDDKLGAWAKRFGEVVYVKQGKYPWWPSCIVDPESLNEKPAVIKRGVSLTGKQYTVYFYNDNTVGFATPANLRPFNADTKAEFATQKFTNKGYEKSYPIAIGLAEQELLLDQDKRLAWCTVTTAPTPAKKRGRQPKAKAAVDVDEIAMESSEEEDEEPTEEIVEDNSEAEEPVPAVAPMKRGRPRKTAARIVPVISPPAEHVPSPRRGSRRSAAVAVEEPAIAEAAEEEAKSESEPEQAPKKRRGRQPKVAVMDVEEEEEEKTRPSNVFDQESAIERLVRLTAIVTATTDADSLDKSRALKTMEKLLRMDFSLEDLRKVTLGKVVSKIAKGYPDPELQDMATKLKNKMQEIIKRDGRPSSGVSAATSSGTPFAAAAPSTEPVLATPALPAHVLDVSLVPAAIHECIPRFRALRLLHEVTHNVQTAIDMEDAIFSTFASKPTYFECVCRFYAMYKAKSPPEANELITTGLQGGMRGFLHDTFQYSTVYV